MPGPVWMAMINFPFWFAHLDRAMMKKELASYPGKKNEENNSLTF
jgi:hypothetical protein